MEVIWILVECMFWLALALEGLQSIVQPVLERLEGEEGRRIGLVGWQVEGDCTLEGGGEGEIVDV